MLISGGVGGFSETEASDLAKVLQYGSTPVEMKAQAVQTVSATLGQGSLRAGIVSGLIGIGLVLLFMILYYRSLAWICAAGLAVTAALMWSIIGLLSQTSGLALTLAGITGIIVSIGVTVDSYVVFFERLKDEVHSGKTFRSSAQRGFKGAWHTILAANTVSLIGAAVLWYLSVGAVRGFAFFLGLSTLLDMIIAYTFTRPAVLLLSRSKRYQGHRILGVSVRAARARRRCGVTTLDDPTDTAPGGDPGPRRSLWYRLYHGETTFDFVGRRKIGFTISLVLLLITFGSLLTRRTEPGHRLRGRRLVGAAGEWPLV